MSTDLPQTFERLAQRDPLAFATVDKEGAGIDADLRQERGRCHPLPFLLCPAKGRLHLNTASRQNSQNRSDSRMRQRTSEERHIEKTGLDQLFGNNPRRRRGEFLRRAVQIPSHPQGGIKSSDRHAIILTGGIFNKYGANAPEHNRIISRHGKGGSVAAAPFSPSARVNVGGTDHLGFRVTLHSFHLLHND